MEEKEFKELMKPIADGLFGPQKPYHMGGYIKHYAIRPLPMIVEDLCSIEEADWYAYAFSREVLNGKFKDDQRRELMNKALECGRSYARKLSEEFGTTDVETLAKAFGAVVDYPEMPQSKARVLFAEFREPNKIHVYNDAIKKGQKLLTEDGIGEYLGKDFDLKSILLGHELFHMVENRFKKEIWTLSYKITLWHIGPIKNTSVVNVLGEIAAMAFTKELNGISFSPYVLDALLTYGYDPETACGLYEEMMERVGRTPRRQEDLSGMEEKESQNTLPEEENPDQNE